VVSAGLRWARTGAVMSNPLLSRSSTPEYCQGDCTGKGQPALRRVAPRRSPITPYVVSLRWTQDDDDDEQKVEGGSVREAVLTNLWLTALNQLQPTYVRCPEGKPSWLPDCLLDQGRNVG
jgi:hypothetical protein